MQELEFNTLKDELHRNAFPNGVYSSGKLNSSWGKEFKSRLEKIEFNGFDTLTEKLLSLRLNLLHRPLCECGTPLKWNSNLVLQKFCSSKCSATSTATKIKRSDTNLEKYGAVHSAASSIVRTKIEQTKLEKYGRKSGNLGLDTPWNKGTGTLKVKLSPEELLASKRETHKKFAHKMTAARKESTKKKYLEKVDGVEWSDGNYFEQNKNTYLSMKHVPCGTVIEVQLQTIRKHLWGSALCKTCNPVFRGVSKAETDLFLYVQSIYPDIVRHKKLPSGLELDLYDPVNNVAIEYNGLYWHSEKAGYPNFKHLIKTEEAEKYGIKLIHLFEDEWIYKRSLVESRLKVALGIQSNVLYARKLKVVELSSEDARAFLEANHIQGYAQCSVRLGLMQNDELVSVMTFGKPRFNKKYDWELIRFASKAGLRVQGGAGKLLSHFNKTHQGSILSYADRRWSDGNLYEKLGFSKLGVSAPAYWYFKGDMRENRQTYQKAKLKDMPEFSSEKTEAEIMFEAGWNRIWDCGNLVYIKV